MAGDIKLISQVRKQAEKVWVVAQWPVSTETALEPRFWPLLRLSLERLDVSISCKAHDKWLWEHCIAIAHPHPRCTVCISITKDLKKPFGLSSTQTFPNFPYPELFSMGHLEQLVLGEFLLPHSDFPKGQTTLRGEAIYYGLRKSSARWIKL